MIQKNLDLLAWLALVVLFVIFPGMSIGRNKPWDNADVDNPYAFYIKGAFLVFVLAVILFRRWRNR